MGRFRFVDVGVAALLAAGVVSAVGLVPQAGAAGSGALSSFVPITPCRLLDTRPAPDTVGERATPLATTESATFAVWGTNGNCTVPTTAKGIVTNATAVNPSSASYVTIYPADATRPTASNLNTVEGGAPSPNQVTVGLSVAGAITAYNNAGTVDLVIDIVGYFEPTAIGLTTLPPHDHDDRYYTEAEVDAKLATKVTSTSGATRTLVVGSDAYIPEAEGTYTSDATDGFIAGLTGALCFHAPVELPNGATVLSVRLNAFDNVATNVLLTMLTDVAGYGTTPTAMASVQSSGTLGSFSAADLSIATPVIDTDRTYTIQVCMSTGLVFYDARVIYRLP